MIEVLVYFKDYEPRTLLVKANSFQEAKSRVLDTFRSIHSRTITKIDFVKKLNAGYLDSVLAENGEEWDSKGGVGYHIAGTKKHWERNNNMC